MIDFTRSQIRPKLVAFHEVPAVNAPYESVIPVAPPRPTHAAPISVAYGDGVGPEIMTATLEILAAGGALLAPERISVGEQEYRAGHTSGIPPEAWESLRSTRVMLKGPITTPQGGGYKSLNVTLRKALGLFANVRPCASYAPYVPSRHPKLDLVIVRENEEDLYAGIEHRQTDEVYQCLKLVSRPGCERVIRHAFAYARAHGRKRVTCMTKDNIMKLTDGLFHRVFDEVAAEHPDLATEHMIIDIGAARLADTPERFDVIVTPNLYGDIISDVAAQIAGSVGMAGSANIGESVAMFEAIHGSAPDIAGKDVANPSGLLQAAVMMLVHLGQVDAARTIHDAWLATLEDGVRTADVGGSVGTRAFARAVIERLGQAPRTLPPARFKALPIAAAPRRRPPPARKEMVGVDVFVQARDEAPEALADRLRRLGGDALKLSMITNRGVKVWPEGLPETFCTDHWRCRFLAGGATTHAQIVALLAALTEGGVDVIKTENLCTFDGAPGYSLGQGQ